LADESCWIQLCGDLKVRMRGERVESRFPGRQGRLLFGWLVVHRRRPSIRDELMGAVWPERRPAAADAALNVLLAKLRSVLGPGSLAGRHEIRLLLPRESWIDLEAASEALHRAESALALGDWTGAWGPSRVALHIGMRRFLAGCAAPWIDDARLQHASLLLRAYECVALGGLRLGGAELPSAERSARALVRHAPLRESGYQLLMEVLQAQGNVAEALLVYEQLRHRLRGELGTHPGAPAQALHVRLLRQR
jgi:DNA-binding SARP family transcriptional activator